MKIIVLHGDDTLKSYSRLKKFIDTARERSWEVVNINEGTLSVTEAVSGASLFGEERFFIIRDIKSLDKKTLEWLTKNNDLPGNLIVYHENPLSATVLKSLPKDSKIEEFKLPILIWTFLDNLSPGQPKVILSSFHKIIETEAIEFIFSLMTKQFRDLYWVKTYPETLTLPAWRVGKLKGQSIKFADGVLEKIIDKMATIDYESKTGRGDLLSELDLLIIKWLE